MNQSTRGAQVWDDPNTVDLLVAYQAFEYLVEVKSVTVRNFIVRLRHALGQVLYYDYLRSLQSQVGRRKVIAVAAQVPTDSWCVSFLNTHVDIDLLSLNGRVLQVHSTLPTTHQLFAPV